jgi:mono/diheme cytochrome c family protein
MLKHRLTRPALFLLLPIIICVAASRYLSFADTQSTQQTPSGATWELPADAAKTVNPIPSNPESIAKGKELYLTKGNCIFCHGETGAGNQTNLPRLRRTPADLTDKKVMSKNTDGELFWKVTRGIPMIMPPGEKRLNEEERWHVVNYIKTLAKQP